MKIYHLETKSKSGKYSTIGYFVDEIIAEDYQDSIRHASEDMIETRLSEVIVNTNRYQPEIEIPRDNEE